MFVPIIPIIMRSYFVKKKKKKKEKKLASMANGRVFIFGSFWPTVQKFMKTEFWEDEAGDAVNEYNRWPRCGLFCEPRKRAKTRGGGGMHQYARAGNSSNRDGNRSKYPREKKRKNWRPAAIFRPLLPPPLCIRDKKY